MTTAIDPNSAEEAARRLLNRFMFQSAQLGASEARILHDGQQIQTAYLLKGEWERQEDAPLVIWPQMLRRVRNMARLTLGPQPPRQEGAIDLCILDRPPDRDGEEHDYDLQVVITHDQAGDEIHFTIPKPVVRPLNRPEGFECILRG